MRRGWQVMGQHRRALQHLSIDRLACEAIFPAGKRARNAAMAASSGRNGPGRTGARSSARPLQLVQTALPMAIAPRAPLRLPSPPSYGACPGRTGPRNALLQAAPAGGGRGHRRG